MNSEPTLPEPPEAPLDDELRPHSYDGIREYDKRLPNWWLFTLYGTILFSFGYWSLFHHWHVAPEPGDAVTQEIRDNALLAAKNSGTVTDEQMWAMSKDPASVDAGRTTFTTTCVACHGDHLQGKIGPTLIKDVWLHGGKPTEIIHTITTGVPVKGMPTWGPVLGRAKILEVASFILSLNHPPKAPPAVPAVPAPPAPAASAPSPPSTAGL
jgi:cytochrome c oxidase cbb3-type subunit 3